MSESIQIALITGGFTLLGVIITFLFSLWWESIKGRKTHEDEYREIQKSVLDEAATILAKLSSATSKDEMAEFLKNSISVSTKLDIYVNKELSTTFHEAVAELNNMKITYQDERSSEKFKHAILLRDNVLKAIKLELKALFLPETKVKK